MGSQAGMFSGSSALNDFLWKNIIIEKRISLSRLDKLYKKSPLHDFWSVLSSPVN